jgi:hypothetical protein
MSKKARVKFPMEGQAKPCGDYGGSNINPETGECPHGVIFSEPCAQCGKLYEESLGPKPQFKPVPFSKKHKVVHKVEDPNAEAKLALVKKAAKLRGEIFKDLPCVLCLLKNCDRYIHTVPHHILNKGAYDRLRFILMNLIPLCVTHHRWAHEKERIFRGWLLDNLPKHARYYLNERDNRKPIQQTVESLTKIVADLQHYADNPLEAEQVIYEKE